MDFDLIGCDMIASHCSELGFQGHALGITTGAEVVGEVWIIPILNFRSCLMRITLRKVLPSSQSQLQNPAFDLL